jgi:hypothetical protein
LNNNGPVHTLRPSPHMECGGAGIMDYYAHTATRPDGSGGPDRSRWQWRAPSHSSNELVL